MTIFLGILLLVVGVVSFIFLGAVGVWTLNRLREQNPESLLVDEKDDDLLLNGAVAGPMFSGLGILLVSIIGAIAIFISG